MLRSLLQVGLFLLATLLASGQAPTPVFLVRAYRCPGSQPSRSLTAFRVVGVEGAVTALHGVAGCESIRMESDNGPGLARDVAISKVNIDADLATLESSELTLKYPTGLAVSEATVQANAQLEVLGYPEGLLKPLRTTFPARAPAIVPLHSLLSEDLARGLGERTSPSVLLPIVSIQGNLLPGHSGAPIFDQNHRVVAIGDGGLKEGTIQISWAIPVDALRHLIPRSRASVRLDAVIKFDSAVLFSLLPGADRPSTSVALRQAAERDDVESLVRILQVTTRQSDKDRALFVAATNGSARAVRFLIDSGADPKAQGHVICAAVYADHAAVIKELSRFPNLIEPNVICESPGNGPGTPLEVALDKWYMNSCCSNNLNVVRALLAIPATDTNVSSQYWGTPLHLAVYLRSEALTSLLVHDKRVQKNKPDSLDRTPADAACADHRLELLRIILDAGGKGTMYTSGQLRRCLQTGTPYH